MSEFEGALDIFGEVDGVEVIQKTPIFSKLGFDETTKLAEIMHIERHPKGRLVIEQDGLGQALYIVRSGTAVVKRRDSHGQRDTLGVLGPGEVFGEMALLDDSVRSADARVHERCRLLAIHRDAFEDLLFVHKDLAYEVLWNIVRMLTKRLRETNEKFAMLSFAAKL